MLLQQHLFLYSKEFCQLTKLVSYKFTVGAEYSYKELFALRTSWAQFDNRFDGVATEAFSGPAAGFTFNIPMGDGKLDLSYAYRLTNSAFGGVHTVGTAIVL